MKLSFHGAARSVTGSRHLLEVNGKRILLDCGLVQGAEAGYGRNHFDFDAQFIDAVILSHAHIDHSGALPILTKFGFSGPIYATPATVELTKVMLADSGALHEADAHDHNLRLQLSGRAMVEPLYTLHDAQEAGAQLVPVAYKKPFEVADGVTVTFRDAGHILGSAFVQIDVREGSQKRVFVFSGDIGRHNVPIIRPPDPPEHADILVMESTYGDHDHPDHAETEAHFGWLVRQVAEHGGKLIIPAFAVGRVQQITYMLNRLWNQADIPEVPVFVDSPLALAATEIFQRHHELWGRDMLRELSEDHDPDPFGFETLKYCHTREDSKELNDYIGPAIIIAASGMCEGGRIVHHLANHLENPHNVILLAGYQAAGTLGRRLVDGERRLVIHDREIERKAAIVKMTGLSAHAGRAELHAFYDKYRAHNQALFVVHGEIAQAQALASWASEGSAAHVAVPSLGQSFDL